MHGGKTKPIRYGLSLDPQVNRNALEVLGGRQPGLDRSLAFLVLDGELCRLSKAAGVLDLALGKALVPMLAGGYEAIGYARVADYCIEELGFGRRTAELLRQQADLMDRFSGVRKAFLAGQINQSHARLLLSHLVRNGGDEDALVQEAQGRTVRALGERLDAIGAATEGAPSESSPAEGSRSGGADPAERAAAMDARGEKPQPEGEWRVYQLTPALLAEWDQIRERSSRLAGTDLRPWQVLELLAAEFLTGAPVPTERSADANSAAATGGCGPQQQAAANIGAGGSRGFGTRWDRQGPGPHPDWRQILEEATGCWSFLERLAVEVELDAGLRRPVPSKPRAAHRLVADLILCRRRLDIYLGRMLRTLCYSGLARQGMFASICHYSAERLGLGASTTSRLISRDRGLAVRPKVFKAIVEGRIGISQADVLLRLPDRVPDAEWISFAEIRTCRALDDSVAEFLTLYNAAPAFMKARGYHPPAEGEDLGESARQVGVAIARGVQNAVMAPASPVEGDSSPSQSRVREDRGPGPGDPSMFSHPEAGPESDLSIFSHPEAGPGGKLSLRVFLPAEILPVIAAAEAAARHMAGRPLSSEECMLVFIAAVEKTYSEFERRLQGRRRRALARARYRCAVPGCRARQNLHLHHVVFRSQGGTDEDENLVPLCPFHHLRGVHEGRLRIRRKGQEGLVWEVGVIDGVPTRVYRGEVRLAC